MPTILQFRRGTTAQNNNYTGSIGELTVDTDLYVLRVHDGSTAGGNVALVGDTSTQTLTNKTLTSPALTGPTVTGTMVAETINAATIGNSGAAITGTLQTAAQTNVTSLGTLTGLTLSGTLTGTTINAATIGNSGASLTGTIQTASQPNITGVGTITAGTWQGSTIAVAYGGTGTTSSTGTGAVVLASSPTLTTPILGTPGSGTLTNCTGLPIVAGTTGTLSVARGGTGVTSSTGSGSTVLSASPTMTGTMVAATINADTFGNLGSKFFANVTTHNGEHNVLFHDCAVNYGAAHELLMDQNVAFTYNPGTATLKATNITGLASSAKYADLAEKYLADRYYEPGTVVVFGGEKEITACTEEHDAAVAGVISTKPAYLMNNGLEGEFVADVALVGRVPCKVIGPVKKGTALTTSKFDGVAMAVDNLVYTPGCIIGRSLVDHPDEGIIKIIEISVGRS